MIAATEEPETKNAEQAEKPPLFGMVNDQPLKIPIIGLCGNKGSGKTIAAATIDPEDTTVVDIEDSSVSYNLPFKKRYSMYEEVQAPAGSDVPSPIDCWLWFTKIIKEVDSRVLMVDPITDLQQGLVDWVRAHPELFNRTANQYSSASGLLWADVKAHLKMVLGTLSRRVECFVFTAHMGSVWAGGKPAAGKQKAKGVDTFYELASLYLHLSRDPDKRTGKVPAKPVASIVPPLGKSRLARTVLKDGDVEIVPILPPRMPDFSWKALRELVAKPMDYGKLGKQYQPESHEMTDDERLQLQAEIAADKKEAEELKVTQAELAERAAQRNRAARQQAAASAASDTATEGGAEKQGLKRDELETLIKSTFAAISDDKSKLVAAIEKRGGKGCKLADLSREQAEDLLQALRAKQMLVDSQLGK